MFIGGVVTVETKFNDLIKLAKHYNIEYYGMHKKQLVEVLNQETKDRIEREQSKNLPKPYEPSLVEREEYKKGFVDILNQILPDEETDPSIPETVQNESIQVNQIDIKENETVIQKIKSKYDYTPGSTVYIIGGLLINRKMKFVEPSERKEALKGHLINEKSGELQKTLVTIPLEYIGKEE